MTTDNLNPEHSTRWTRTDYRASLAAMVVGLLLAVSPHLAMLVRHGTLAYVGDGDAMFYMTVARAPYYGSTKLRDPFCGTWENVPCLYSWLQFVPLSHLARCLGLPLISIGLLWRTLGGLLLGFSLYYLFRQLFQETRRPAVWSLLSTLWCLSDAGFCSGRILLENAGFLRQIANGATDLIQADALPQYRVVTPLLNLPLLLLVAAMLLKARQGNRTAALAGAACLGACIWTYFFFWTAAALAIALYIFLHLALFILPPNAAKPQPLSPLPPSSGGAPWATGQGEGGLTPTPPHPNPVTCGAPPRTGERGNSCALRARITKKDSKGLISKAQGCRVSRLPWESEDPPHVYPEGVVQGMAPVQLSNPFRVDRMVRPGSQGSRETRQPWAMMCNPFGVLLGSAKPNREVIFRRLLTYSAVLLSGFILGLPQIISNQQVFSDPGYRPILERMCRGFTVPSGHPWQTIYLRNFWVWSALIVGAAAIVGCRWRVLTVPWVFVLAGYLLKNSAIVTRLEFENFHWTYVHASMSEVLLLGLIGLSLDRWPVRLLRGCLCLALSFLLLSAFLWRPYEALHSAEAVRNHRLIQELAPLKPILSRLDDHSVLAGPFESNVALLFCRSSQLYHGAQSTTAQTSLIPDRAVHERHALNAWLQGLSQQEYEDSAFDGSFQLGPIVQPQWSPEAVRETRAQIYKELLNGAGNILMGRYRPDTLLLPAASPRPQRGGPWHCLGANAFWSLWSNRVEVEPDN